MTTKTCTKCGVVKPLDEYGRNKSKRGGRQTECKTCAAERQRRYREENLEREAENTRRYREKHREEIAERHRRWREANREELAEKDRRYREENLEVVAERGRRRHEEYRELSRAMATVPRGTRWSSEEDALIMADNGMTMFQKAIELGRTYASVNNRRYELRARLAAA